MGTELFADRVDAGQRLGRRLQHLRGENVVVLGLPRGGVVVAAEVARALDAPLDVVVVRKLGVLSQPELAMGAIGEGGVRVVNDAVMRAVPMAVGEVRLVEERERAELERRAHRFRRERARVALEGCTALVVDDGLATGSTARAACQVVRLQGAARVVLAVPVAPPRWERGLAGVADELVCLETPPGFYAIGQWYADFTQVSDEEVLQCLEQAGRPGRVRPEDGAASPGCDRDVEIPVGARYLPGRLTIPRQAAGVIVFAHGSGSSRLSPRNRLVAKALNAAGLGTLLFDLLTEDEAGDRTNVFDIELLAGRLIDATRWLATRPEAADARFGWFGASTGAAAALWAAADPGIEMSAVVSRGGRPDLAGPRLSAVRAATLLIVGSEDVTVLALNRAAEARLRCPHHLALVAGAGHLFEEPGALGQVAELAADWFIAHLAPHASAEA
jgi:putative phosphoribosyl transferase